MLLGRAAIGALALVMVSACVGHRGITPSISEPPREGLFLERPVRIAILDVRPDRHDSAEVAAALREGLSRTYGDALFWVPYFESTPADELSLRIRVLACGADFGSRLVRGGAPSAGAWAAASTGSAAWDFVRAEASPRWTLLPADRAGPGWWIGSSWLELQIEDRRFSRGEVSVFPIAAEHRQPNVWGYLSADRAAQRAWSQVAQELVRSIDLVLTTVRDLEER